MKKSVFLIMAVAAGMLCLSACQSAPPPKEPEVDFSRMTPEERENYEALQRARKRIEEKNRIIPAKSHKGTQITEKKSPLFERNSEVKRKKYGDPTRPVLLNDDASIFKWRDDGRRSDKLREQQRERRESYID